MNRQNNDVNRSRTILPQPIIFNTNPSSNKTVDNKHCEADDNCGLLLCSGCFNKNWLKAAPPDLPCMQYSGYKCKCINSKCSAIR